MISVLFSDVTARDPVAYVHAKLASLAMSVLDAPVSGVDLRKIAGEAASAAAQPAHVPLVEGEDLPKLGSREAAEVRARERCLARLVGRSLVLEPGEEVHEDLFSFLSAAYGGFDSGTVVLRRRTNLATLHVFPQGWSVDGTNALAYASPVRAESTGVAETTEVTDARETQLQAVLTIGALGVALATGVVSGIGSKIGAAIFDEIFPPSVPSYFEKVYKQIEAIVRQEIHQNTVDEMNGRINGLQQWVRNTYMPQKNSGTLSKKDLTELLRSKVEDFGIKVTGVLQTQSFASVGLTVFMIGADVHLALLQELALVDPNCNNPLDSTWAVSVKLYARDYSTHAAQTFDAIVKQRRGYVSVQYDAYVICVGATCHAKDRYKWVDALTNTSGSLHEQYLDKDKKNHNGSEEAEADKDNYLVRVITTLTEDMSDPKRTAGTWNALQSSPIPPQGLAVEC